MQRNSKYCHDKQPRGKVIVVIYRRKCRDKQLLLEIIPVNSMYVLFEHIPQVFYVTWMPITGCHLQVESNSKKQAHSWNFMQVS
jgi:hypothetical protein